MSVSAEPVEPKAPAVLRRMRVMAIIGPGLLVAATGVGAGDLATASFAGSLLGPAVLWAVVVGATMKWVLNEGLARWQLVTGRTLLDGCVTHIGMPFQVFFALYLISWSFFVGAALMSACGVTMHAIIPVFGDADAGKLWFGILHAVVAMGLVLAGGFRLFEKMMAFFIALMFATVVATALWLGPDWPAVLSGLLLPRIPGGPLGQVWTVALVGGVGGTLTVLCYGYWLREAGREAATEMPVMRLDLGAAYSMTAIFGLAMVVIGSEIVVEGRGAGLIVSLAAKLEEVLGTVPKWIFLTGAWGAVFSSLFGVLQSVPYLFADFAEGTRAKWLAVESRPVSTSSRMYRGYLIALTFVPMLGLSYGFQDVQKYYAVIGAGFMPFLAAALLYLNGRRWLGDHRNGLWSTLALSAILAFFVYAALIGVTD